MRTGRSQVGASLFAADCGQPWLGVPRNTQFFRMTKVYLFLQSPYSTQPPVKLACPGPCWYSVRHRRRLDASIVYD